MEGRSPTGNFAEEGPLQEANDRYSNRGEGTQR
jgi:hypothetical protein